MAWGFFSILIGVCLILFADQARRGRLDPTWPKRLYMICCLTTGAIVVAVGVVQVVTTL